jgi:hypothetical protein
MPISLCTLFILGAMFVAPQTTGNSTGSFTVGDKTTELRYARALETKDLFDKTKRVIRVVLSDAPITDDDMDDPFALGAGARAGKLHAVEIFLSLEGEPDTGSLYHEGFGPGHTTFSGMHRFERKTWDGKTVAGKLFMEKPDEFNDKSFIYTATFSAALEHEAKPTAEGAGAAASGPGKAMLEFVRAARARDVAAFKRVCTEDRVKKLEGQMGAQFLDEVGKYYDAVTTFKILRVYENGDHAKVEAEEKGAEGGNTGSYKLVRENGEWKEAE